MRPVGKTYLIKIEPQKDDYIGNILLPQTAAARNTIFYIGKIHNYGIGFTEEEISDLLPLGTKVIMDYTKKAERIRLIFGEEMFYIYKPEDILAIIEEYENESESEEK
jgi:co-chaperonin GroES (HSP10)